MPTFNEIISLSTLIYSDIIEPCFCALYAYILIRICIAESPDFRSAFYKFSVATGFAAIGNVLMNLILRLIDVRFQIFPNRGIPCTLLMWASHVFALTVSIGKTLSVSTRFTSICLATRIDFWDGKKVKISLIGMLGLPFALYAYFPFYSSVFGTTASGYGVYLGITNPEFLVAKAFATCGYFFFLISTIFMCSMSLWRLRSHRISARMTIGRHEKLLAFYAVVLTTSHLFKSILQSVWFIALVSNHTNLQAIVISLYLIPNTLSTFAEPVLLLVFSCLSKRTQNSTRNTGVTSTVQNRSPRVEQMEMTRVIPSIRFP